MLLLALTKVPETDMPLRKNSVSAHDGVASKAVMHDNSTILLPSLGGLISSLPVFALRPRVMLAPVLLVDAAVRLHMPISLSVDPFSVSAMYVRCTDSI